MLLSALKRILENKKIFVNERTIKQRKTKYEMAANPIGTFLKITVNPSSTLGLKKSASEVSNLFDEELTCYTDG